MRALYLAALLLAGCASSQEYVATRSDMAVCRFTMGGPHARAADAEARSRGLNCMAMYPAIQAQMANENAATSNAMRALQPQPMFIQPPPAPVNCSSYRVGNSVQTTCQ